MTTILSQNPTRSGTDIHGRVAALLAKPGLQRFRASVAYVRWSGLGALSDQLEALLEAGAQIETIFGIDNGVTSPDALLYAVYLKKVYRNYTYAGASDWNYSNSIFHPKLYEFRFANRSTAVIGSCNLTGGGLKANHELAVEFDFANDADLAAELDNVWLAHRHTAKGLSTALIAKLAAARELSPERAPETGGTRRGKLKLQPLPVGRAPLYERVLKSGTGRILTRHEFLAKASSLSEKPRKLYLQLLHETGGGHQIQLPVATLGAFFGVGPGERKTVTFTFSGGEETTVLLTHFENNTHRVRLLPVRSVPRPAVLVFSRAGEAKFSCRVVEPGTYARVLRQKCTEQTRRGARRWGFA